MKWINNSGYIQDAQDGELIALMSKTATPINTKMVEIAPEMFSAIISFVESIESGKFAAKSTYNELKEILSRVPENLIENARV